jgi:phosphomethylpyrimidine synthase
MTQLESAREGRITPELKKCAKAENLDAKTLRQLVADGRVVIEASPNHKRVKPLAIGDRTRIKINANIGTSPERSDVETELEKLKVAVEAGADTVMDLSTGGDLDAIRKTLIENCTVPVGTVPIYQAAREATDRGKPVAELSPDHLFEVIEKHGEDGVSFITVHCGVTIESLERLRNQGRVLGIVSRGGAFLCRWMDHNEKENPLYEQYNRLLEIARKYDMTLSLGDGLRPGCIADATDRGQIEELIVLGELTRRARDAGVQVMIEGPGHVPLDQIEANVKLQKQLTGGAPFYVLGPLVTDIAPGYDHITGAIGGTLAAWAGADFLCYVTPSEHLSLPGIDDVRHGVIASKIAAHAADIARGTPGAAELDLEMSTARANLDWETQKKCALSPIPFEKYRESNPPSDLDVCTMCGDYCAVKVFRESRKKNSD